MSILRVIGSIPNSNPLAGELFVYMNASNILETRDSAGVLTTYGTISYNAETADNKENNTVTDSSIKYPTLHLMKTYVEEQSTIHSTGPVSEIVINTISGGVISLISLDVVFNTENDFSGSLVKKTVPQLLNQTITANTHYYIIAKYNNNTPVFEITSDYSIINCSNVLGLACIYWENLGAVNETHIFKMGVYGNGLANKISKRLINTKRFERESGLALSESTGLVFIVESGIVWFDGEQINLSESISGVSLAHFYYHSTSQWAVAYSSQYNNSQYDNGTSLVTLSSGRYAVNWIYRIVSDIDDSVFYVVGNGNYNLVQAQSSQPPTLPDVISKQCILVGRIIVEKGASVATQIDSAFQISFSGSPIIKHSDLADLSFSSSGHTGFQGELGFTPENIANKDQPNGYAGLDATGKIDPSALSFGYTPEDVANKENTTVDNSTTKYPTVNLLKTYVDDKSFKFPVDSTSLASMAAGFGALVGQTLSSAYSNMAIGYNAISGALQTLAIRNLAIGFEAMKFLLSGEKNTAIGYKSSSALTTGSNNVSVGHESLLLNQTGNGNIAIGENAGSSLISGSNNVLIGNVTTPAPSTSDFLNIKNIIFGNSLNGSLSTPSGYIGIGTNNPSAHLHVVGPQTSSNGPAPYTLYAIGGKNNFGAGQVEGSGIFLRSGYHENFTGSTIQMFGTKYAGGAGINILGGQNGGGGPGAVLIRGCTGAQSGNQSGGYVSVEGGFATGPNNGGYLYLAGGTSGESGGGGGHVEVNGGLGQAGSAQGNVLLANQRGNVGIKNSSPTSALQVTGETKTTSLVVAKTSGVGIKVDEVSPTFGWRDLIGEITARGLGVTDPSFNTYITNIRQYQFSVNDEVWLVFHVPHDYVPNSDLHIHAHWSHSNASVSTGGVTWGFDISYSKGHNQAPFAATKNVQIQQNASTVQYQHMIAEIQMTVAGGDATRTNTSLIEVDGLILVRAYLVGNTINGTPEPFLHTVDIHYQSTGMATKQKAPNFYV